MHSGLRWCLASEDNMPSQMLTSHVANLRYWPENGWTTFRLFRFHRPEGAEDAVTLWAAEGSGSCSGSAFPALPCGWKLRRPGICSWIRRKSSLHFNKLVNNPEELWFLRVSIAGCCFSAEFGCVVITPTAVAGQAVFFFPQNPLWTRGFYPQLWSRIHFCGGGFFIQGESIIFSSFLEGKVSIMKSWSSPLRDLIPVCCGPPEAAIGGC